MVKFVRGDLPARAAKKIVLPRRQGEIAEARQLPRVKAAAGQNARHRLLRDRLRQIHEAAALGNARKAALHCGADAFAHGCIFSELPGIQLWIAAAEIQPVQSLRQCSVYQRAERHKLRAERLQKAETVLIVKAERPVPRHADADRLPGLRQGGWNNIQRLCAAGNGKKGVQIQTLLRLCGEELQLFAKIRHLGRSHKSQMAALEPAVRQLRQKAAGTYAEACFQLARKRRVAHGRAAVQNNTADPVFRLKLHKALHHGQHGQRRAARLHDKHDRAFCLLRDLIGAGAGRGQSKAVIVAHDALDDRRIAVRRVLRQQEAERLRVEEKRVEVGAFRADDPAVEHRVNVIRAAFGCGHAQAAVHQRLQNGAGHGRFAAATVRPGKNEAGSCFFHRHTSPHKDGCKIAERRRERAQIMIDLLGRQTAVGDERGSVQKAAALQRSHGLADGAAGLHQDLCAGKAQRLVQREAARQDLQRLLHLGQALAEAGGHGAEAGHTGRHDGLIAVFFQVQPQKLANIGIIVHD